MGTSALQICSRLVILLALGHAAVINSRTDATDEISLASDEICPCIVRDECPRIFGTLPEDALLGNFPPCVDPEAVRCCGVSTSVSIETTVSEGGSTGLPKTESIGRPENKKKRKSRRKKLPVIPPDIQIPVPFQFPEYLEYRTTTPSTVDEVIAEGKQNLGVELGVAEERGESIDDNISRGEAVSDAFVSSDRLDYRGVNKYGTSEELRGGAENIRSGSRRGKISSSSKKVESNSETSEKKSESFFTAEDITTKVQTADEIPENESFESPEFSDQRDVRLNDPNSDSRTLKVATNRQEASVQQKSETVKKESSNFEESSFSNSAITEQQQEELEAGQGIVSRRRRPTAIRDQINSGSRSKVTTQQQNSETVTKESKNISESSSSRDSLISTNVGSTGKLTGKRRRPIKGVYQQKNEASSQQNSQSVEQESSKIEKSSKNFVSNSADLVEQDTSSEIEALQRNSKDKTRYGRKKQISSQANSESVKKESSRVEESSSSNSQALISNTEIDSDGESSVEIIDANRKPTPISGNAFDFRGGSVYGQQKQTSSQQQSKISKKESSTVEESSSSKSQTLNLGSDITSDEAIQTNRRPTSIREKISGSKGKTVYGQQVQTTSQQNSETLTKKSSEVEESSSSGSQTIILNNQKLSSDDASSDIVEIDQRPALIKDTTFGSKGNTVYGQQKQISSKNKSESVTKESSSTEESSSSKSQNVSLSNRYTVGNRDTISGLREANSEDIATREQFENSSNHKKTESKTEESSSFEKSKSSTIEEVSLDHLTSQNLELASQIDEKLHADHKETITTQEQKDTVNKQSSSLEENSSSLISGHTSTGTEIKKASEEYKEHSSTNKKSEMSSSESHNTDSTSSTITSNLMNLLGGKISNMKETMDENRHSGYWRVANRTYVPVLINAGFLKDRPTSTGQLGLDPFSGVTHSDILNPHLAPELLPLSCGNVVFGERVKNGKTLVCEIPHDNIPPIRFPGNGEAQVSRGKLKGPILPDAIIPRDDSPESNEDRESFRQRTTVNIEDGVISKNVGNSEATHNTESRNKSASTVADEELRKPIRIRKVLVKRPTTTLSVEDDEEAQIEKAQFNSQRTQGVFRGNVRHSTTGTNNLNNINKQADVISEQTSKQSQDTMSSSSVKTSLLEESVSKSSSSVETNKSESYVFAEEVGENDEDSKITIRVPEVQVEKIKAINDGERELESIAVREGQTEQTVALTSSSSSKKSMSSTVESVSSSSSTQEINESETAISSDEDYYEDEDEDEDEDETPDKFYVLQLAPILPPVSKGSPKEIEEIKPVTNAKLMPTENDKDGKEKVEIPTRPIYSNNIRNLGSGGQRLGVESNDQLEIGSRQVAKQSISSTSSSSKKSSSTQESVSSSSSALEVTKSEFDDSSIEEFDAERTEEDLESKFYTLPLSPILPFASEESPEVDEGVEIVEVIEENPVVRTKVGKRRMRLTSSAQKQPPNDLKVVSIKNFKDNGAILEEQRFVLPEDESRTPNFLYHRNSRQVKEAKTLSPESLAMPGRAHVIGPLPTGFKDPAVSNDNILPLELPVKSKSESFRPAISETDEHRVRVRDLNAFRPSPLDPISWS